MNPYDWFKKSVIENPKKIFLFTKKKNISYLELNKKIKQLMDVLGKTNQVGIICKDAENYITGLLAVYGTRGIPVPLDPLQKKLLDYYTSKKGYKNWEKMINYATNHQDYRHFEDLIKGIGKRVSTNEFGWNQLKEEIDYCKKKKDFAILDTEELRKNPEKTLKKITKIWKFKFKKNILTWKKGEFYEISKKNRETDLIWYESLMNSNQIIPTRGPMPNLNLFPAHIQKYVKTIAMPKYNQLKKYGELIRT